MRHKNTTNLDNKIALDRNLAYGIINNKIVFHKFLSI